MRSPRFGTLLLVLVAMVLAPAVAAVSAPLVPVSAQATCTVEGFTDTPIEIMAPAAPGGGWDTTAREMQRVMQEEGIAPTVEVYNVEGAGGTVGIAQLVNDEAGNDHQLMMMGLVMIGAIATNASPVTLEQTTPISSLTAEFEVIVVPADSRVPDARRSHRRLQGGPNRHLLGRGVGRWHRPHPGRADRPGGRCRSDADQLRPLLRRRRSAGRDPGWAGLGRCLRHRRVDGSNRIGRAARPGGLREPRERRTPAAPRRWPARWRRRGDRPDAARAGHRRRAGELARGGRAARDLGRGPGLSHRPGRADGRLRSVGTDAREVRLAGLRRCPATSSPRSSTRSGSASRAFSLSSG